MDDQRFETVFQKMNISRDMRKTFSETLVRRVSVSKSDRRMRVELISTDFIPYRAVESLERELALCFREAEKIKVELCFDLPYKADTKKILATCKEDICYGIAAKRPMVAAILDAAVWSMDEATVRIALKANNAYLLTQGGVDVFIARVLERSYGIRARVQFEDGKRVSPKNVFDPQRFVANSGGDKPAAPAAKPPADIAEQRPKKPGEVVLGRTVKGFKVPISATKTAGETAVIEGEVLSVEVREIRGEKLLVKFDITDYTDSTTALFFVKKEKFGAMKDSIAKGKRLRVEGEMQYDKYSNEINLMAKNIELLGALRQKMDEAEEKRVELHLHTQMSRMDGLASVKKLIARAAQWGHKAIAITDHGVVQAFPDAMSAGKKEGIKIIYGMEGYLVNDMGAVVVERPRGQSLDDTFVVFDIETTGFYKERDKLTEIGAVKLRGGQIVDTFSTLVDPAGPIPPHIVQLTGITDEMVKGAATQKMAVKAFLEFAGDAVLVAHNASFDVGFIRHIAAKKHIDVSNTVLDTLELSRSLYKELGKHKLNLVCKHLGIPLENHHRAVDDAGATAQILLKSFERLKESGIRNVGDINTYSSKNINYKTANTYHIILLAKNQTGLKNLYELVSISSIEYFHRRPRILKSLLQKHREGLIIGTACEAGELYRALLEGKKDAELEQLASFYDYLEIQPLGNNQFLLDKGTVASKADLIDFNKKIIALGEKLDKPVVATCDVHFMDPEDEIYRRIILKGEGFDDADNQPPLYFRTTEEMLAEFDYLTPEKAQEVVITNTNRIADMIEAVKPIPDETYPPVIDGAEDTLRTLVMEKAHEIYGQELPQIVAERLDKELNSIIKNGFSVMYIIAQKLVWNSVENGYLVGSRGSVGSSFAATMAGITEVNPLPPHYVCTKCKYSDFESKTVRDFAGGSGCDMPDKDCPVCGAPLKKDGHDIPFETFLGFDGDKEPDIDLNFSGEYQQNAHAYTEELFGSQNVFKAGTIGTLAEKTAYGYVKKYFDEKGIIKHNAEINRLVAGCTGVKRTTGQHPGGLMVVPRDQDIHNFTPVQRPANDMNSTVTTTHFDYHSISGRLLKLDLLGHDDPTVIRMLYDLTGKNPQEVPLDDPETMSLFTSTKALGVTPEQIDSETGSLGLPEFGTKFVRQMLKDTKPKTFAELVRIAGLSHGTDVWLNNAQDYVRQGIAELKEIISTRDDIMVYLILQGVEKKTAFKIMEDVRKGKGLKPEYIEQMKANNVPQWYIDSCEKIKYMFPKAHAAAYVMMAFRIAYFKVHYPVAFYTSYFSVRADDFDYLAMCRGEHAARMALRELNEMGNSITAKDKNKQTILEVVVEMYARGIEFLPLDLYESDARWFRVKEGKILPAFNSLPGLGTSAAESIVEARKNGEFYNVEDLRLRTNLSKTVIQMLIDTGVLEGMPLTSQLTLI